MNKELTSEWIPKKNTLTHSHIKPLSEEVPNWQVMNNHHLSRTFVFFDFEDAIKFVNKVAVLAEKANHHPDIYISYNNVRVDIWTHKIDGLTESDFILAKKIDHILHKY